MEKLVASKGRPPFTKISVGTSEETAWLLQKEALVRTMAPSRYRVALTNDPNFIN